MARTMVKAVLALFVAVAAYGYVTEFLVPAHREAGVAGLALHACVWVVAATAYMFVPEQE